jgi:hypothetical protein
MKRGFNILLILMAAANMLSCDGTKSYNDYLKDEKKAINRFFDEKGFEVLKDRPDTFKENEFIRLSNGVYLNVIDFGNEVRPVAEHTNILFRFKASYFMTDTFVYDYFSGSVQPLEFVYGGASSSDDQYFFGSGVASVMGLDYLGDSAVVKLIVPFTAGSSLQGSNYEPLYFERLKFTFERK